MTVAEVRAKWNRRYGERLAEGTAPEPNPLALRFRHLMGGHAMLDAACGLGRGLAAALDRYEAVYAVDLSDTAVRAARRLWPQPHIRWIVADVNRLRWPAGFFDLICSFAFTDWDFLRRAPGLVAPGGLFLYQGFSRRQLTIKPELTPAWTSTPASVAALFPDWEPLACEESDEPPYRVSFAARRPGRAREERA